MLNSKFFLLPLLLVALSCNAQKQKIRLSQNTRASLIKEIRLAQPEILLEQNIQELKDQLIKSSMGASYYYSYVMENQGDIQQALQLVINEIEAQTPFAGWAALRFLELSDKGAKHNFNLYNALIPLARSNEASPDPALFLATGYAAFSTGRYQEAIEYLTAIDPDKLRTYPFARTAMRVIALAQTVLKLPGWEADLDNFFFSHRGGKETIFALAWLRKNCPHLTLPIYTLYNAINLDAKNQSLQAYDIIKHYIQTAQRTWLNTQPHLITQFANIAGRADRRADAIPFLLQYLPNLSGEALFQAQSALGALSFNLHRYKDAVLYLTPALEYGGKSKDLDRVIWYYLSALYQNGNIEFFITQATRLSDLWHDPYYFRGLFQTVLNDLVSKEYFHYIYQIYRKGLREFADATTSVHYAWVLARATFHDLLLLPKNVDKKMLYNSFLTDALSVPWTYSSIMAYSLLDEVPPFFKARDIITLEVNGKVTNANHLPADRDNALYTAFSERALGPGMVSDDVYALGFLYYNLPQYEAIYSIITTKLKAMRRRLSTNALRLLGREFDRMNLPADSINMMIVTTRREDFEPTKADYMALYPRGYKNILEDVAKNYNIPPHILYGLVWNESLFQNSVVSRAKAVGLGQLMEPTAKEMARLIGMTKFDLTVPADNLLLTAVYFDWLRKRFNQNLLYVLMSYNAGMGHVRRWATTWDNYPPELFVEASPFGDTRGYVRDITADSAIYGYLYFDIPPSQTIKMIFNDLKRSQDDSSGL